MPRHLLSDRMGCAFGQPKKQVQPSGNNNSIEHEKASFDESTQEVNLASVSTKSHEQDEQNMAAGAPVASSREVPRCTTVPELEMTANGHLVPQKPPCTSTKEGFTSVHEMYNFMNDGHRMPYMHDPNYILMLDVRDPGVYKEKHITTARHSSAVDKDFDCLLEKGMLNNRYMMIVIYDEESTASNVSLCVDAFGQRLRDANVEFYILDGGFKQFSELYPFLCNNLTIRYEAERLKHFKSYPSMVLDDVLYQGNVQHSLNAEILNDLKITHILNVSTECKNAFPNRFKYFQLKFEDETSSKMGPRLPEAAGFIADAISEGGRVLVHCVQGKSRSSTCTIAFLMTYRAWTLKDAHDYLKEHRPIAAPNRGFLIQLSQLEESLFDKVLSSVDDIYF